MDHDIVHAPARDLIGEIFDVADIGRPGGKRPFSDLVAAEVDPKAGRRLLGTYLGRANSPLEITFEDETLLLSFGDDPVPLRLVSETAGFVEWEEGYRDLFQFEFEADRPSYAFRVRQGRHYDFDPSPEGIPPGPDKPGWDSYLGEYKLMLVDKVIDTAEIRRENGDLYFDQHRLGVAGRACSSPCTVRPSI